MQVGWRYLIYAVIGLSQAGAALVAAQPEPAETVVPAQDEADRLTGASLSHQARQQALRVEVKTSLLESEGYIQALIRAAQLLESPVRDLESTEAMAVHQASREQLAVLDREQAQIERWLFGEEQPDEPGVTRSGLGDRLAELRRERRNIELLVEAQTLEGTRERQQRRGELLQAVQGVRAGIDRATAPIREQLTVMEKQAAELGEQFEQAMSGFGRISQAGPVAAEAVRTDGWFQHGQVSYRWSDRRGRLIATAQVRLRPSTAPEPEPPLLLDRFAIDGHTDQEVSVSVGHFTVVFRVAVPELNGEQQVLDALTRLLDLEALGDVRPILGSSTQN